MAHSISGRKALWLLYSALFFFSFHVYFLTYIQSTYISQFIDRHYLSFIYGFAALIAIATLLSLPKILTMLSSRRLLLWLIMFEFIIAFTLAWTTSSIIAIITFIAQLALIPLIASSLDIVIEGYSTNKETGVIRGLAFTSGNIALIISPMLVGIITSTATLNMVYYLSNIFLIPLFSIIWYFNRQTTESNHGTYSVIKSIRAFLTNKSLKQKNIRANFAVNLFLQFFYTWMVIYTPLYFLDQGFNWGQIGIIFSIMLLPFLIFELPLGKIADKYIGEKEIMICGFIIMAISTGLLSFTHSTNVLVWALILFGTRVGASFIEIMSETYFFKKVNHQHIYDIGLFRITRPLSQVIAPVIAASSILFVGKTLSFIILGCIVLYGIRFAISLKDTK